MRSHLRRNYKKTEVLVDECPQLRRALLFGWFLHDRGPRFVAIASDTEAHLTSDAHDHVVI